jgi:hypothetical protein
VSGAGPRTVVLLHEMSSFLERWDEIAPDLERDHSVLIEFVQRLKTRPDMASL